MAVDVIIVNWNGGPELIAAVNSALRFGGRPIVVDNASADGVLAEVERMAGVTVIHHATNRGFAAGCNSGVAAGDNDIVLLLNPDAEIVAGTADDLASALSTTGAMAVGPLMEHTSGRRLSTARSFPTAADLVADLLRLRALQSRIAGQGAARTYEGPARADRWLVGSAVGMRRADWSRLGGMDEGFYLWYEDIDLCARVVRAGGGVAVASSITIRHQGASTWQRLPRRRRQWLRIRGAQRYARRHLGLTAAIIVTICAPAALLIGVAQDIGHRLIRSRRARAVAGHTSKPA